jgi:hypothetical protein
MHALQPQECTKIDAEAGYAARASSANMQKVRLFFAWMYTASPEAVILGLCMAVTWQCTVVVPFASVLTAMLLLHALAGD